MRRFLILVTLALAPNMAVANDITDVIDADDGDDPFDFRAGVTYRRMLRRAKITREYNCNPSIRAIDNETCAGAPPAGELINVKELRYTRVIQEVVPELRLGLWHDLELLIQAPIVIADNQEIRFAGNGGDRDKAIITPANSTIAPGPNGGMDGQDLFPVPGDNVLPERAGFGDMLFKIRYAPIAQERDDQRGDWMIELGYRAPTGETMKFGNEAVGRSLHEIQVGTGLSRRFRYVDPFIHIHAVFPIPSKNSLFKDYGDAQEHVGPGNRVGFDMGAEFVPYDDTATGMKVMIDLGVGATYQGEGRDYSELFDALAGGAQVCDSGPGVFGAENCGRFNPDSRSEIAGEPHNGLTTVEEHVQLRTHLGLKLNVANHLRLGVEVGMAHDTEHFISNADVGKDLDGSGLVEAKGTPGFNAAEQNPTFVAAIDQIGRRIRVEETTIFTVALNLGLMF